MPTTPPTITALPTAPNRTDPTTFSARADAWVAAVPSFSTQLQAVATATYNNAVEADQDATAAAASQAAAAASQASAASSAASASTNAATATTKAAEAAASAAAANTSAGNAAGSAASALAIYGSTAAQQAAVTSAQNFASQAAASAASASSVVQQDLSGINAAALHRSPNAVTALFIYDTSKDSDGGAWTERCQHTSWYNEDINGAWRGAIGGASLAAAETTARAISGAATGDYFQYSGDGKFYRLNAGSGTTQVVRGNKRDFPRMAAIVCQSSGSNSAQVVIYDLTEPGRPMWMAFTDYTLRSTGANLLDWNGDDVGWTHAAMRNGWLVGTSNSASGMCHFIKDWIAGQNAFEFANNRVRDRLAVGTVSQGSRATFSQAQNNSARAVRMMVEPGAPVEPETGLPRPSVAIGSVAITYTSPSGTGSSSQSTANYDDLVVFPRLIGARRGFNSFSPSFYYTLNPGLASVSSGEISAGSAPDFALGGNTARLAGAAQDEFLRSPSAPMVQKLKFNRSTVARSAAATITNTFNTGHQIGDIRRTFLADIGAGSAGPTVQLVTNDGFDSNTAGWTVTNPGNSSVSVSAGVMALDQTAFPLSEIYQAVSVTPGKRYLCEFRTASTGGGYPHYVRIGNSVGASEYHNHGSLASNLDTYRTEIVPSQSTIYITLGTGSGTNDVLYADFVRLYERVVDRSYKAASATITGTLTKTEVASAAQLVAYSGWSAANYAREAYSADLDFGTGDWSIGAWINIPASAVTAEYPVYGTDLLAGAGAFTSSAGWSGLSADCTISGGSLTKTGTTTHYVSYSLPSLSLGDVVLVKFDVVALNNPITVRIGHAPSWNQSAAPITTTGTQYRVFTAFYVASGNVVGFDFGGSVTGTIQNLTVFRVRPSTIVSRAHSSGAYFELTSLGPDFLQAVVSDGTTTRTVVAPPFTGSSVNPVLPKGVWLKAEAFYRAGRLSLNVNGIEVASTAGVPLLTLNNSNAVLTIGNNNALNAPFPGSIALLKLSATVPSPDQALWMYEQEKQLFRAGAQCCLPDSGNIVDLSYDEVTDRWVAVSAANESYWSGLVRASSTAVPAGSFTRVTARAGIELAARSTTTPGVDVTIPAYGLREELVNRAEAAARLSRETVIFDYVGGFTANTTNGSAVLASVANLSVPVSTTAVGAQVTGSGIPASTTLVTTTHLSAAATATATGVQINFTDFILPVGYEARAVLVAGAIKQEGATKDFTRLFDGFRETIRFGTAPGNTAWVQIQAVRVPQ